MHSVLHCDWVAFNLGAKQKSGKMHPHAEESRVHVCMLKHREPTQWVRMYSKFRRLGNVKPAVKAKNVVFACFK